MSAPTRVGEASADQSISGFCGNCKQPFRLRVVSIWQLLNEHQLTVRCQYCRAIFRFALNGEVDLSEVAS